MKKGLKHKNKIVIILIILLLLLSYIALNIAIRNFGKADQMLYARISVDGLERETLPLSVDIERKIIDGDGENTIAIKDESIYMIAANCPDGDCIRQGEINGENIAKRAMGNAIVCLPNKLFIEVISENKQ